MPAGRAKLFEFQPVLVLPLVPRGRVVAILTVAALHGDDFAHFSKFPSSKSCVARLARGKVRGKHVVPADQKRATAVLTLDPQPDAKLAATVNIPAQAFRPGAGSKADVFAHFPARLPFQFELNGADIVPRDNDDPPRTLLR